MPKQRARPQVLKQLSDGKLRSLLSDWIVNDLPEDFGFDYDVRVTEVNPEKPDKQIVTGLSFYIQLKSTDDDCEKGFFHDLSITDFNLYLENTTPVLLIKYYSKCDLIFYEIIHSYVWDVLDREDPKWRENTVKRIHLTKKLDDLQRIKKEIQDVKIRIIRKFNYYNMSLGEGIHPSEYDSLRIKDLQEYKYKTIRVAFSEIQTGNEIKGITLLEEAYRAPKEDLLKFSANVNLILQLNPLNPENHAKIIQYSKEGIELSKKIGDDEFKDFLTISICNVWLVQNITKIGQLLFAKTVSKKNKGDFALFYEMDLIKLYQIQEAINKRIQSSLENMLKQKNIQGLVYSSATLMDSVIYQVQKFVLADENYLKIETGHRRPFIENFEKLLSFVDDENSLQFGYYKLAQYFFWICNYEKAEYYILKAIEISKKLGLTNNLVSFDELLGDIKNKKSPSDPRNRESSNMDEITFTQIREATIRSLKFQGIIIPESTADADEDRITEAIRLGLEDIDPSEYLKYCEHIRVGYLYSSMLGQNIGLFSLGPKVIWCSKSGAVEGLSLKMIFSSFKEFKCKNCDKKKRRYENWVCTWKKFEEMILDPEFQEFLKHKQGL
ncbi:MAG: DUF4365 domain-containing protein [Methanoregula sp.]|jgi:hypothetical protein